VQVPNEPLTELLVLWRKIKAMRQQEGEPLQNVLLL
jgi:hypothetical protein